MAKKEDNNGRSLGDITTLRNILMGEQMEDYDGRFTTLENQVQEQEVLFKQKLKALEQRMAEQMAHMQKDMSMKVNSLEERLQKNMQSTNAKIEQQRIQERQNLGKMLVEMGKRLLE